MRLSVSDTGIGIPEDAQAKLFQPYAQAARSFKRSGGTGLGLAITRDLVVLMLGKIAVVSKPGAGTTVDVSLPVLAAPRNAVVAEPVARQPAGARPAHGLRVLVAVSYTHLDVYKRQMIRPVSALAMRAPRPPDSAWPLSLIHI